MKERTYTYKFRLYPSKEQETYLAKVFGCFRLVYNHFLSEKQNQYKETKTFDNYYVQQSKLTELRRNGEYGFLNDIPLQSLQFRLRNDMDVNAAKNILKYKSVRNIDHSRGVVCKPDEISESFRDCPDNYEAISQNRPTSLK